MDKIQARWNLNRAVGIMGNSKLSKVGLGKHVYNKLSEVNRRSMKTICRDGGCKAQIKAPTQTSKRALGKKF